MGFALFVKMLDLAFHLVYVDAFSLEQLSCD